MRGTKSKEAAPCKVAANDGTNGEHPTPDALEHQALSFLSSFPPTPPQSQPTSRMFRRWEKRMPGLDRNDPSTWPRRVFARDGKWYPVFQTWRPRSRIRSHFINARSQLRMAKRKAEEFGFHENDLFLIDEISREVDDLRRWLWDWFDAARVEDQPRNSSYAEHKPNEPCAASPEGGA